MHRPWFARRGWLHRPASLAGWLITAAALARIIHVFLALDARSHSVTDVLCAVYPHWGVTFPGWDWIARRSAPTKV